MRRAAEQKFSDLAWTAAKRLVSTTPQTLRGAAAMLAHVREYFDDGYPLCEDDGLMVLLGSVERAICSAAGLQPQR